MASCPDGVRLLASRTGSRQATGREATVDPCKARDSHVLFPLHLCPGSHLRVILSKHSVLQQTKYRGNKTKQNTLGNGLQEWPSQVLHNCLREWVCVPGGTGPRQGWRKAGRENRSAEDRQGLQATHAVGTEKVAGVRAWLAQKSTIPIGMNDSQRDLELI